MSEDTWQAVADALRAHLGDEQQGLLTDWVAVAACVLPDDSEVTGYQYISSKNTPAHSRLGLALAGYRHATADWDTDWDANACDDTTET